jgi:hypothetical protein
MSRRVTTAVALAACLLGLSGPARAQGYDAWPPLKSTFASTGGGGIMIKGYDPVIREGRCVTTFMAVTPGDAPMVYANYAEFDAVPRDGGVLCTNGRWRAFEGGQTGTTPFEMFFKDGTFRAKP